MQSTVGKEVRSLMKVIRKGHFARADPRPDPRQPVMYWEETSLGGKPYMVPLVILRTRPCRWFSTGGCVMCNYELLAVDEGVSDEDVLQQAQVAIDALGGDLSHYPYLLLTSQGSFLDNEEVHPDLRSEILRLFWRSGLRSISTESEARYCLDGERLRVCQQAFPGRISVGIGLEAADDFVRNSIINKGLPLHMLENAAQRLSEAGIHFYTYISLGKPFLTPEEDITDAVMAVALSSRLGAFMSVLEMINIQPHTLTERMWRNGMYTPCNLWNGVEVLRRLPVDLRESVSVKGFDADVSPVPLALPESCPSCRVRVRDALNSWNLNRNFSTLNEQVGSCSCAETNVLGPQDGSTIADRASRAVSALTALEGL